MPKKRKKKIKLRFNMRFWYFTIGMIILSFLMIFSFQWDLLPFRFMLMGDDITKYALPPFLILIGAIGSSMLKSSITGEQEFDT